MFHSLLSVKLAAMAAALGLNTSEWSKPSPAMVAQVQKLEAAMKDITDTTKADKVQAEINEALQQIRALADKGDKDAQFAVAHFSQQGNQQGSVEQAMKYYELSAKQGQLQAMNNLGAILATTSREPEKQTEGLGWIKKASDAGEKAATRNLARLQLVGVAGQKADPASAEKLLTSIADKDSQAAFDLSRFYLGEGGQTFQNQEKAWTMLNKASDMGNPSALDALGTILVQGGKIGTKEIPAEPAKALEKFKALAAQNNAVGLRRLGEIYLAGVAGQPKDFKLALENLSKAAQGNDAQAQFRLAAMYDTGVDMDPKDDKIDVQPNASAAMNLYRAAAQNNLPVASYNVGIFYEQGRTVDRDLEKAFAYFQQAAQSGVPAGMLKVGAYYFNGIGTIKDPVAASGWFARSAAAGLPEGHLNYGIVSELGLVPRSEKESPFYAAADSYLQAADAPQASPAVQLESLFRLGSLYFRGVMVAKGDTAKPDYEKAYVYFKQAVDIDPKNEGAASARDEAVKKLSPDQVKKGDASAEEMKKVREKSRTEAAKAAPAAPAPAGN